MYTSSTPIKLLIADDHDLVRMGLAGILDAEEAFTVVGQASSGEEAIQMARQLSPDVVLMDIKMPGIGGVEATQRLTNLNENMKVIAVSSCEDELYPSRLMQAGASAYLTKKTQPKEVVTAIHSVLAGKPYVSQEIAQQLALKNTHYAKDHESPFQELSDRELQIAMMIIQGVKAPTIAKKLNLTSKTVNSYRYRIFEKLDISNDVELVHFAIKHKLFDVDTLE